MIYKYEQGNIICFIKILCKIGKNLKIECIMHNIMEKVDLKDRKILYEVDLKDRKILYELDYDSRQSFSQIGKKVGLHKNIILYRVKRLMEKGIIRYFYTVIDSFKLGYNSFRMYIVFQNTTPAIKKKKKSSTIFQIISTHGG